MGSLDEFRILIKQCTPTVLAALNHITFETYSTKLIDHLYWPQSRSFCKIRFATNVKALTYESNHQDIKKEHIERRQLKQYECDEEPVQVHMINMDWFNVDNMNFIDLAKTMKGKPDEFYNTEFVTFSLAHFWPDI